MRKQTRTLEEILVSSKYEIAKKRADEIDAEIIETLKTGKNFRVEAGAGSGKTYSLNIFSINIINNTFQIAIPIRLNDGFSCINKFDSNIGIN